MSSPLVVRIVHRSLRGKAGWSCIIADGVAPFYLEKRHAIEYAESLARGVVVEVRIHDEKGALIETRAINGTGQGAT